jgi:hypothetical protein
MPDSTLTPSAWRAAQARGIAPQPMVAPRFDEDRPQAPAPAWLSFRDLAAIQIAAAMKGVGRDLSPRETAEVAFDLAHALEEERARRDHRTPG